MNPPTARSLFSHIASRTRLVFIVFLVAWLTPMFVHLPPGPRRLFQVVAILAFFIQVGFWIGAVVSHWVQRSTMRHGAGDGSTVTTLNAVGVLARLAAWVLVTLLALDNLGIEIKALIAGLGIGGIAVALAAQNVLGDLFAALAIVIDKPFLIGDSIAIDGYAGKVEDIGMKTTRIRSETGELIVIANGELLKAKIRNYSR